jgi:hypothetical protein
MEPLTWNWSSLVQVASALVIAIWFVAFARSAQRAELRVVAIAWLANLAALAITLGFWQLQSNSPALFAIASTLYFFAKTQFAVLLVAGATGFAVEPSRPVPHSKFSIAIAALSIVGGILVGSIDRVGMVQSVTMGAILLAGAIAVSRTQQSGWQWTVLGFVLRTTFAACETAGYAFRDKPIPGWFTGFMAMHGAFDAGAEWLIAVGCALMFRNTLRSRPSQVF